MRILQPEFRISNSEYLELVLTYPDALVVVPQVTCCDWRVVADSKLALSRLL
jgi:hypothetical protein